MNKFYLLILSTVLFLVVGCVSTPNSTPASVAETVKVETVEVVEVEPEASESEVTEGCWSVEYQMEIQDGVYIHNPAGMAVCENGTFRQTHNNGLEKEPQTQCWRDGQWYQVGDEDTHGYICSEYGWSTHDSGLTYAEYVEREFSVQVHEENGACRQRPLKFFLWTYGQNGIELQEKDGEIGQTVSFTITGPQYKLDVLTEEGKDAGGGSGELYGLDPYSKWPCTSVFDE